MKAKSGSVGRGIVWMHTACICDVNLNQFLSKDTAQAFNLFIFPLEIYPYLIATLLSASRSVQIQTLNPWPGVSTCLTKETMLCSQQSRGCRWEWTSWRPPCQVKKTKWQLNHHCGHKAIWGQSLRSSNTLLVIKRWEIAKALNVS